MRSAWMKKLLPWGMAAGMSSVTLVSVCATLSAWPRFYSLSIFFCISLQDFFSSRRKAETFMPVDSVLLDDMVVGISKNAEVLTSVRIREGLVRYLTQHGKHTISFLQLESRSSNT
jgi:hypothetical protein